MPEMSVRYVIVDDEPQARRLLTAYLQHFPHWTLQGEFGSALEALERLKKGDIDVMYLDIHMPHLKGTDFLRSFDHPQLVILTTAYEQYAIESYSLHVLEYLLKPISMERFIVAVNKAEARLRDHSGSKSISSEFLFIKADNQILKVRRDEILYIEAMQNYVRLITRQRAHIVNSTMKLMETQFTPPDYIRIHKSYIVAVSAITRIEGNRIYCGDIELPMGAHYRPLVMQYIKPV